MTVKGNEPLDNRRGEMAALISLLDDPDDSVVPVVRERLKSLKPNIFTLQAIRDRSVDNALLVFRLDRMIAEIGMSDISKELDAWHNERDPELLKGLWLVYRALAPEVEYAEMADRCMDMVKDVWMELSDTKTVVEKIHLYNHIFYHRIGFHVEDPFLTESIPAFLDKALEHKKANPVLLGLLYLDVANRAGLPIRAMIFPGGFMPVCVDENEHVLFYINIFNTGEIFGKEQLISFLQDFGISISGDRFVFGAPFSLAGIYAESLYYIAGNMEDKEMEEKMEQVLTLFGEERILLIEEDDDDDE